MFTYLQDPLTLATSPPPSITWLQANFRAKLRTKFKNYRKRHSEEVDAGDGRVVEGVPNYSPPVKKSAVDIRSELSSVSEMIAVVPSAEKRRLMKSSFPERRFLIVKTQTKLTSLLKLFPALLTNEGVSVTGISACKEFSVNR